MPTDSDGRDGACGDLHRRRAGSAPSSSRSDREQQRHQRRPASAAHAGAPDDGPRARTTDDGRAQRQRRAGEVAARGQRQGEPELGAGAGLPPDLQPAAVQPGVLEADRQAQPAAAHGAHPGGVGPPEPVEDVLGLGRARARRRSRGRSRPRRVRFAASVISTGWPAPCSIALPTRLRRIRSTRRASTSAITVARSGRFTTSSESCRSASAHMPATTRATSAPRSIGSASSTAAPASYRLISSRSVSSALEPVQLGAQQLGRAGDVRREVAARLVQHVGGHLHGRQRRAQLVGDVGGEPLLQLREPLELGDLPLQAVGHGVEAGGQPGQVVLAADDHPLLELALGQPLGGAGRPAHRVDHQPGHQHADADDEQRQRDPADDHRAADQREALLLLVQREGVVQLDLLGCPRRRRAPAAPTSSVGCGTLPWLSGTSAYR